MTNWRVPLDSSHRIGLSTLFGDILTVVWGHLWLVWNNVEIRADFGYYGTASEDMANRSAQADSVHWIGLFTCQNNALIVVRGALSGEFKITEIFSFRYVTGMLQINQLKHFVPFHFVTQTIVRHPTLNPVDSGQNLCTSLHDQTEHEFRTRSVPSGQTEMIYKTDFYSVVSV